MLTVASAELLRTLAKPSKVASVFDWKKINGSVLSLNIHKDRIGMAVAAHPSYGGECHRLPSFRFPKDQKHLKITDQCKAYLSHIIRAHRVCGMIVAWPLQKETGKMGAACGRVIYALEGLLKESGETLEGGAVVPQRPLCLWDSMRHHSLEDPQMRFDGVDVFGRDSSFSRTSSKQEHLASKEQYCEDEEMDVEEVWKDFSQFHWPQLYRPQTEEDELLLDVDDDGSVSGESIIQSGQLVSSTDDAGRVGSSTFYMFKAAKPKSLIQRGR